MKIDCSYTNNKLFTKIKFIATAGLIAGCMLIFGGVKAEAKIPATGSLSKVVQVNTKLKKYVNIPEEKSLFKEKTEIAEKQVCWDDNYTKKDLKLMACIIYCESGGMNHDAKLGVANVILNRVNDKGDWAHVNTIEEVIYDRKWGVQFDPIVSHNGKTPALEAAFEIYDNIEDYKDTWRYDYMTKSIQAAKDAFCGEKSIPNSYMYFNGYIDKSKEKCINSGKSYKIIESHIYF